MLLFLAGCARISVGSHGQKDDYNGSKKSARCGAILAEVGYTRWCARRAGRKGTSGAVRRSRGRGGEPEYGSLVPTESPTNCTIDRARTRMHVYI